MKVLSIGVSVCRPDDEFNETLGKTIAEGKATKYRNHALYAVDAGLINETMVKALLQQEAEYFKVNPGRYLAGYDRDAEKYRRSERIESYIDSLEGEAKTTFNYLTDATDEEMENMAEAVTTYSVSKNLLWLVILCLVGVLIWTWLTPTKEPQPIPDYNELVDHIDSLNSEISLLKLQRDSYIM